MRGETAGKVLEMLKRGGVVSGQELARVLRFADGGVEGGNNSARVGL